MFEKSKGNKGKIIFNDSIITNIVTLAVSEVEGVALIKEAKSKGEDVTGTFLQRLKFETDKNDLTIQLSFYVYYGYTIPEVAFKVQEAVKNGVENMTGYHLKAVDVTIMGVITPNEA